ARTGICYESSYAKVPPNDTILKFQRTKPYYKRNRAHVFSFYIRGECTRGAECPYWHEMPITGKMIVIMGMWNADSFLTVNDPVALKLLNKAADMPSRNLRRMSPLRPFIRLDAPVTEQDHTQQEKAAEELSKKLVQTDVGRPQASKPETEVSEEARQHAALAHGNMLPRAVISPTTESSTIA
ncbi:LOW QUALITY PROTEIN: hypothetical protein RJ641_003490, partial [Dillenia turbinata]